MDWNLLLQVTLPLGAFSAWVWSRLDKQFEKIDQRFEKIDLRFDKMDQRFDRLEKDA